MKIRIRIIIYSLVISILYYIIDSAIGHFILYKDLSFIRVFITGPPAEVLVHRLTGITAIILLGLIFSVMLTMTKSYRRISVSPKKNATMLSSDADLLINLSHQLKTPLNAIIGFSDLLKDPRLPSEPRQIYVNHISSSGKYLLELVNDISDMTKLDHGLFYTNTTPCRVNKLLQEIRTQFEGNLKEKAKKEVELILKTGFQDENFTILTDQGKFKQILTNLLENAVMLTDEGYIEFGYKQKNDLFLEFYVKDTGSGLSVERLEKIMDYRYEVVDDGMRPFDTAAMRINISKQLVTLLGGKLEAESVLLKGSEFTFILPLNEVQVHREKMLKKTALGTYKWETKQILIAEDVESNFIYLKEILKPTGVQIQRAMNGREAVEICEKNKNLSIVLMDILMPEMDGYEAARKIKELRPYLPVIAQTAYSLGEEDYKEADKYFDKYLIKPIWSHELLNTLSGYLA